MKPSAHRVRQLLSYDPIEGTFRWRVDRRQKIKGTIAGCIHRQNDRRPDQCYWIISIDGVQYRASHLAWLYVYGQWPKRQIDHIDSNQSNDRISNLREASQLQNARNRRKGRNNKSGFKGVWWLKDRNKWGSEIRVNGRVIKLGRFNSAKEAHMAYCNAALRFHGEFSRIE